MLTLGLISLVGGLIAGISPCVLPVLPVIFMSGSGRAATPDPVGAPRSGRTTTATALVPTRRDLTPYAVVAGLAISFSVVTLLGALALSALPVPQDLIRWVGLVLLVLLGIGMIVPAVEQVLERPFSRLQFGGAASGKRGFVLGLALGAVYVPCAGPVLAAITVAGATGRIGGETVVLTVAFAVGTAIPLLFFALAGQRVSERVRAFREHQRVVRRVAGVVVLALAVALSFNVTDAIQSAVPDYTTRLDHVVDSRVDTDQAVRDATGNQQSQSLQACAASRSTTLLDCGKAPAISGIAGWQNTPDDQPVTAADLVGKVYLVDFWAYSCINCQRAIPHVEAWYARYHDEGFDVIGVHTPEYAFEHVPANVAAGAKRLGITYPIALDPDYKTWDSFGNDSWPAEYLVDATGTVRHVSIGEGDYDVTERLIRQLLAEAEPGATLPDITRVRDTTPTSYLSSETYLGYARGSSNYRGSVPFLPGRGDFDYPDRIAQNQFVLDGGWDVGEEDLTAGAKAGLAIAFTASKVYLDVGGTGTVVADVGGEKKTFHISGAPDIYPVVDAGRPSQGLVILKVSPGLKVYSFTFG